MPQKFSKKKILQVNRFLFVVLAGLPECGT